jgi:hypothetical protein
MTRLTSLARVAGSPTGSLASRDFQCLRAPQRDCGEQGLWGSHSVGRPTLGSPDGCSWVGFFVRLYERTLRMKRAGELVGRNIGTESGGSRRHSGARTDTLACLGGFAERAAVYRSRCLPNAVTQLRRTRPPAAWTVCRLRAAQSADQEGWVAQAQKPSLGATAGWTARARHAPPGDGFYAETLLGEPGSQHRACVTRPPAAPPSRLLNSRVR